jgi:hypothetical protein
MPVVHLRLLELRTEHRSSTVNKLMISAQTTSLASRRPSFRRSKSWNFTVQHQHNENIILTLTKRIIFGPNRVLSRCSLPLEWFPTNCVVREWFPMTAGSSDGYSATKTMIRLDIHVNDRRAGKFKAAFANLRVIPNWPRPLDAHVNPPAPPQVVFVVTEETVQGEMRLTPVITEQYPSVSLLQELEGRLSQWGIQSRFVDCGQWRNQTIEGSSESGDYYMCEPF